MLLRVQFSLPSDLSDVTCSVFASIRSQWRYMFSFRFHPISVTLRIQCLLPLWFYQCCYVFSFYLSDVTRTLWVHWCYVFLFATALFQWCYVFSFYYRLIFDMFTANVLKSNQNIHKDYYYFYLFLINTLMLIRNHKTCAVRFFKYIFRKNKIDRQYTSKRW